MGPIGIITAVCAAIRVGRITILKALIGKAQESQEAVEVEVLSSTSQDVCEIWNGQELVRVQGNGSVLEIVYQEPARSSSPTIEGKQPARSSSPTIEGKQPARSSSPTIEGKQPALQN
jgi:hypothetical protein